MNGELEHTPPVQLVNVDVSLSFTMVYILISCPLGSLLPLWNFETIRGSLIRPKWPKLTSLAQRTCTLSSVLWCILCFQRITFVKNKFDFTTASDWDCVAAVDCLPALHCSVDFFSCPLVS